MNIINDDLFLFNDVDLFDNVQEEVMVVKLNLQPLHLTWQVRDKFLTDRG